MTEALHKAAQAVLDRWDSPQWEWRKHGPTADLMQTLRAALAQPPAPTAQPAYVDSTPRLNVGNSAFEHWFQAQPFATQSGIKQISRDSYAAGMGDPLVMVKDAQPVQQPEPEVDGWPLYSGLPPAQRQPLSDEQAEALIEASDGRWHDGEFRIDGPDLMRLLRIAAQKGKKL